MQNTIANEVSLLGLDNLHEVEVKDLSVCHKCNISFDERDPYMQHLLSFHRDTTRRFIVPTSAREGVIIKDGNYESQDCRKVFQESTHCNCRVKIHMKEVECVCNSKHPKLDEVGNVGNSQLGIEGIKHDKSYHNGAIHPIPHSEQDILQNGAPRQSSESFCAPATIPKGVNKICDAIIANGHGSSPSPVVSKDLANNATMEEGSNSFVRLESEAIMLDSATSSSVQLYVYGAQQISAMSWLTWKISQIQPVICVRRACTKSRGGRKVLS